MHDRRGHAHVPVSRLLAVIVAAAALAACGTSTPSATPASQPTAAPSAVTQTAAPTEITPTAAATPTAVPTSAGAAPCTVADLKASHGLVEGAAGSRLTDVVLVSAVACSIDLYPALGLRGGDGTAIVGSPSAEAGRIDLVAGTAYTSAVRVSNWCSDEPTYPVELIIRLGEDELAVTGSSFPEEGDLPPCSGSGVLNPILEGGPWTVSP